MLLRGVPVLLVVLFWLYCLFEAIGADESRVRNLPKTAWVFIVLLGFDVGAIAWLIGGRPRGSAPSLPSKGSSGIPPEYDRPGRARAENPDDDAAFLEALRRRAEDQRRRAEDQRRTDEERRTEEERRTDEERRLRGDDL